MRGCVRAAAVRGSADGHGGLSALLPSAAHPERQSAAGGPEGGPGPGAGPQGAGPERDGAEEHPGGVRPPLFVRVRARGGQVPGQRRAGRVRRPEGGGRHDAQRDPRGGLRRPGGQEAQTQQEAEAAAAAVAVGLHLLPGPVQLDRPGEPLLAALRARGQLPEQEVVLRPGRDALQTRELGPPDAPQVEVRAEESGAEVRVDPDPVPGHHGL